MVSPNEGLDEDGAKFILDVFMRHVIARSLGLSFCTGLLVAALASAGCGDDEVTGEGGGGSVSSSDATGATSTATSTTSTTSTTSSGATSSTSSSSESGPVGSGGAGGAGEGTGGAGGDGGAGGGEPACPEQPAPYEIADEPEDACAVLASDVDAPPFHVEFIGEPKEVFDYDGTIAVDFAFQYVLLLPIEDLADYTLSETRCSRLAGNDVESCTDGEVDISELDASCSIRYGGRFGIDPSNVNVGTNEFDFTMTLRKGCAAVSNTFTFVVDYEPAG